MQVTSLAEYRYRAELAVLRHIMGRVLRGEIRGIAICTKDTENHEEISVLGDYRNNPAHGVGAAMRMSWRLTRLADEQEGVP
jgi:hypothetical protein